MEFNNRRILLFANIANFAYDNPIKAEEEFKNLGYNVVKFLNYGGAQAYIIENNYEMILSFRGTEITQNSDIIADMKIIKIKNANGHGYVHKGFSEELDKLWNNLLLDISNNKKPLFITGHSLGASLSIIAASRLKTLVSALITFGSPRVGDEDFVNNLDVVHYRIQNNNDIITKLPLESMDYKHHGKCIYLNYYGQICQLTFWQMFIDSIRSHLYALYNLQIFDGIHDHSIENYIIKLNNL
jgi:triacylglycerol lipase